MDTPSNQHVLIVGAGLGGALMACYLARAGYRVSVYEGRPDPRTQGFIGGRSINLALSTRGITALEKVGLADRVLKDAVRMPGRMMHDVEGNLTYQAYSSNSDDAINSVSRGGLNLTLIDAAKEHEQVCLHFEQRCIDLSLDRPSATFEDSASGRVNLVEADFIVGADGAFSAVRSAMQKTDRFDYSQTYLAHGYKELSIPPKDGGGFRLEPHALHIWPRGGSMMIALPNADGSFTCTLFWPFEGDHSFAAIRSRDDVLPFFRRHYSDVIPLMPTLEDDYDSNPTSSLVTVRCGPWHCGDRVVLLGDAAHAIVPFFGQGMNAAFEDCRVLEECLLSHSVDRAAAFRAYFQRRKLNADAIADMAIDNFIEMRDKTASKAFLYRKRFEHVLHRIVPKWFTPLYNMVSFSNIPYVEAKERSRRQWRTIYLVTSLAVAAVAIGVLGLIASLFRP